MSYGQSQLHFCLTISDVIKRTVVKKHFISLASNLRERAAEIEFFFSAVCFSIIVDNNLIPVMTVS